MLVILLSAVFTAEIPPAPWGVGCAPPPGGGTSNHRTERGERATPTCNERAARGPAGPSLPTVPLPERGPFFSTLLSLQRSGRGVSRYTSLGSQTAPVRGVRRRSHVDRGHVVGTVSSRVDEDLVVLYRVV